MTLNTKMPIEVERAAAEQLETHLSELGTLPLWKQMTRLNPPAPAPKAIPHIWRYDKIRPFLLRAGEVVTEDQAERRVLMLINPAMDAPCTTDTLYAGLQLVMPNETARAHRHTAFAMRFIIEGEGGFTAVNGNRIQMTRGDVIVTPTWNWHDHGKDGSGPMIWLDGLDLPQFQHYPVHFVEHYAEPRYPAVDVDTQKSPLVFPWIRMKADLDSEGGSWVHKPYLHEDGSEVSKIIGGSAERLDANALSPRRRETSSAVYHIISGSGYSLLGDDKIEWKAGDTFCLPSWIPYQHFASDETVYLYRFDDKPMLRALGFYRDETKPFTGYV
jgi:gentisate 1,2-dioxygenase